jgi:hypothetical protein
MNSNVLILKLTVDQVQLIANALGDQPYKTVESTINEIRAQVTPQLNPPQPNPEAAPEAVEAPSQE